MSDEDKRHSILGIVSGAIGGAVFAIFLASSLLFYLQFEKVVDVPSGGVLALLQIVMVLIVPVPVHLFCLILGAAALLFPKRRKFFPILSIALNFTFGLISLFPWLWLIFKGMGRV
jgi:hypothetical protein